MHDEEMAIAIVALVFGIPMLAIVSNIVIKGIVKIVCHWRDVSLKMRLVERGMSAYEIEQIVRAGRFDQRQMVTQAPQPQTSEPNKPPKAEYALRY